MIAVERISTIVMNFMRVLKVGNDVLKDVFNDVHDSFMFEQSMLQVSFVYRWPSYKDVNNYSRPVAVDLCSQLSSYSRRLKCSFDLKHVHLSSCVFIKCLALHEA